MLTALQQAPKPRILPSTRGRSQDDYRQSAVLACNLPRKRSHVPHRPISFPRGQLRRACSGRETQGCGSKGQELDQHVEKARVMRRVCAKDYCTARNGIGRWTLRLTDRNGSVENKCKPYREHGVQAHVSGHFGRARIPCRLLYHYCKPGCMSYQNAT
jgi:hypothetical protein